MNGFKCLPIIFLIILSPACNLPTSTSTRANTRTATLTANPSPSPIVSLTQASTAPGFTDTPSFTPTVTFTSPPAADTPKVTNTSESAVAEVITNAFCREGPGTIYPDTTAFPAGTFLQVDGVSPDRTWWRVIIPSSGGSCWISGSLLALSGNLDRVPALNPPPSPTPTLTPTETPTLTPTETLAPTDTPTPTQPPPPPPPSIVSSSVEGATVDENPEIFSFSYNEDPGYFLRIFIHNMDVGTNDGDGIASVRFLLTPNDNQNVIILDNSDNSPGFCIFGGGEPDCNPWVLEENVYKWSPGGIPIQSGEFRLQVFMYLDTPIVGIGEYVDWIVHYTIAVP